MARGTDLDERRRKLTVECGLDAYSHTAELWLILAVAAEARGDGSYQRDCERAMDIALERWGS